MAFRSMKGKRKSGYGKRRPRGGRAKARQGINRSYTAPKNFCETIMFKSVVSSPSAGPSQGNNVDLRLYPTSLPILNTHLTEVYRQFCIRGIKIMYRPFYNNYTQITGTIQAPRMYFATDKTAFLQDNTSVNIQALLTQDNVKILSPFKSFTHYVRFPKPLLLQGTDPAGGGTTIESTIVQTPSNRPLWLTLNPQQGSTSEAVGTEVPHLVGRLVVDGNSGAVTISLGELYYKVYYSVKEQFIDDEAEIPVPPPAE